MAKNLSALFTAVAATGLILCFAYVKAGNTQEKTSVPAPKHTPYEKNF
jgi:hypothetical protein